MEQMIHNCRPLAAMATPLQTKADILNSRDQRFAATLAALSRLLLWARLERRSLMQKTPRLGPRHQGHLPGSGWIAPGELCFRCSSAVL